MAALKARFKRSSLEEKKTRGIQAEEDEEETSTYDGVTGGKCMLHSRAGWSSLVEARHLRSSLQVFLVLTAIFPAIQRTFTFLLSAFKSLLDVAV